jgi:hypothetical protein
MIQQQILAIPPAAQLEVDRLNEQIEAAAPGALIGLIAKRDALLQERQPRPIAIGERF